MPIDLVLLDLDETLLPTELLRDARHGGVAVDLRTVAGYRGIRPSASLCSALLGLASLAKIGLVSSSPAWYVDQLISTHFPTLDLAVKVTYDDVTHLKPDPEPLLLALELAGVTPDRALYIGDAAEDSIACEAAGLAFVGAGWAPHATYPKSAQAARTPQDLISILRDRS